MGFGRAGPQLLRLSYLAWVLVRSSFPTQPGLLQDTTSVLSGKEKAASQHITFHGHGTAGASAGHTGSGTPSARFIDTVDDVPLELHFPCPCDSPAVFPVAI
jgi:hypothetical protein